MASPPPTPVKKRYSRLSNSATVYRTISLFDYQWRGLGPVSASPTAGYVPSPDVVRRRRRSSLPGTSSEYAPYSRFAANFEILCTLGSGSFGTVYKCRKHMDKSIYAIKKSKRPVRSSSERKYTMQEVYALAAMRSTSHVIRYYESWWEHGGESDGYHLFLQTEACDGNLRDLCKELANPSYSPAELRENLSSNPLTQPGRAPGPGASAAAWEAAGPVSLRLPQAESSETPRAVSMDPVSSGRAGDAFAGQAHAGWAQPRCRSRVRSGSTGSGWHASGRGRRRGSDPSPMVFPGPPEKGKQDTLGVSLPMEGEAGGAWDAGGGGLTPGPSPVGFAPWKQGGTSASGHAGVAWQLSSNSSHPAHPSRLESPVPLYHPGGSTAQAGTGSSKEQPGCGSYFYVSDAGGSAEACAPDPVRMGRTDSFLSQGSDGAGWQGVHAPPRLPRSRGLEEPRAARGAWDGSAGHPPSGLRIRAPPYQPVAPSRAVAAADQAVAPGSAVELAETPRECVRRTGLGAGPAVHGVYTLGSGRNDQVETPMGLGRGTSSSRQPPLRPGEFQSAGSMTRASFGDASLPGSRASADQVLPLRHSVQVPMLDTTHADAEMPVPAPQFGGGRAQLEQHSLPGSRSSSRGHGGIPLPTMDAMVGGNTPPAETWAPPPEAFLVEVVRQCLLGLKDLHYYSTPLVHLDIKPGNLLFQRVRRAAQVGVGRAAAEKVRARVEKATGSAVRPGTGPLDQATGSASGGATSASCRPGPAPMQRTDSGDSDADEPSMPLRSPVSHAPIWDIKVSGTSGTASSTMGSSSSSAAQNQQSSLPPSGSQRARSRAHTLSSRGHADAPLKSVCDPPSSDVEKRAISSINYGGLFVVKICDLGLATRADSKYGVEDGDPRYLAPELLAEDFSDLPKADIFSLGASIYELALGQPLPRSGPGWHRLRSGDPPALQGYSQPFNGLLKSMLQPDPTARNNARMMLAHEALTSRLEFLLMREQRRSDALQRHLIRAVRRAQRHHKYIGNFRHRATVDFNAGTRYPVFGRNLDVSGGQQPPLEAQSDIPMARTSSDIGLVSFDRPGEGAGSTGGDHSAGLGVHYDAGDLPRASSWVGERQGANMEPDVGHGDNEDFFVVHGKATAHASMPPPSSQSSTEADFRPLFGRLASQSPTPRHYRQSYQHQACRYIGDTRDRASSGPAASLQIPASLETASRYPKGQAGSTSPSAHNDQSGRAERTEQPPSAQNAQLGHLQRPASCAVLEEVLHATQPLDEDEQEPPQLMRAHGVDLRAPTPGSDSGDFGQFDFSGEQANREHQHQPISAPSMGARGRAYASASPGQRGRQFPEPIPEHAPLNGRRMSSASYNSGWGSGSGSAGTALETSFVSVSTVARTAAAGQGVAEGEAGPGRELHAGAFAAAGDLGSAASMSSSEHASNSSDHSRRTGGSVAPGLVAAAQESFLSPDPPVGRTAESFPRTDVTGDPRSAPGTALRTQRPDRMLSPRQYSNGEHGPASTSRGDSAGEHGGAQRALNFGAPQAAGGVNRPEIPLIYTAPLRPSPERPLSSRSGQVRTPFSRGSRSHERRGSMGGPPGGSSKSLLLDPDTAPGAPPRAIKRSYSQARLGDGPQAVHIGGGASVARVPGGVLGGRPLHVARHLVEPQDPRVQSPRDRDDDRSDGGWSKPPLSPRTSVSGSGPGHSTAFVARGGSDGGSRGEPASENRRAGREQDGESLADRASQLAGTPRSRSTTHRSRRRDWDAGQQNASSEAGPDPAALGSSTPPSKVRRTTSVSTPGSARVSRQIHSDLLDGHVRGSVEMEWPHVGTMAGQRAGPSARPSQEAMSGQAGGSGWRPSHAAGRPMARRGGPVRATREVSQDTATGVRQEGSPGGSTAVGTYAKCKVQGEGPSLSSEGTGRRAQGTPSSVRVAGEALGKLCIGSVDRSAREHYYGASETWEKGVRSSATGSTPSPPDAGVDDDAGVGGIEGGAGAEDRSQRGLVPELDLGGAPMAGSPVRDPPFAWAGAGASGEDSSVPAPGRVQGAGASTQGRQEGWSDPRPLSATDYSSSSSSSSSSGITASGARAPLKASAGAAQSNSSPLVKAPGLRVSPQLDRFRGTQRKYAIPAASGEDLWSSPHIVGESEIGASLVKRSLGVAMEEAGSRDGSTNMLE